MATAIKPPVQGLFPLTSWTVVLRAKNSEPNQARSAMESLCGTYRPPLFTWLTRKGLPHHDAEDIVQGFLTQLIERDFLNRIDRNHGLFRSFLLASLKKYVASWFRHASAAKRGGGQPVISLDELRAESDGKPFEPTGGTTPDADFDRHWATIIIERSEAQLRSQYQADGREELFKGLICHLLDEVGSMTFSDLARTLGMTEHAVKKAAIRMRAQFAKTIRDAVAQTLDSTHCRTSDIENEVRHLIRAFRS